MRGWCEAVSSEERLRELTPEWLALLDRCPDATVFQHPAWLLPWWRHFGSGRLWTLCFWSGGRLCGLLPAFLHEWEGRRQVTLLGNGVSDHLDLLCEPGRRAACAFETARFLRARSGAWDLCDWQDLPATSALLHVPGGRSEPGQYCAELPLPASANALAGTLPGGLRRNIRRYGERLRTDYRAEFETLSSDPDGFLTEALFRLHAARWQTKGEPGMLSGKEAFFRAVSRTLGDSGCLRLHVLRTGDSARGIIYQLRYKERAYGYIAGFDPELDRYSPGILLLHYALGHAIGEGAQVWDFLRGDERYKLQWGAREVPKFRCRVVSESLHSMDIGLLVTPS